LNIVSWTDFTLGFLAATRNLASKKAPGVEMQCTPFAKLLTI